MGVCTGTDTWLSLLRTSVLFQRSWSGSGTEREASGVWIALILVIMCIVWLDLFLKCATTWCAHYSNLIISSCPSSALCCKQPTASRPALQAGLVQPVLLEPAAAAAAVQSHAQGSEGQPGFSRAQQQGLCLEVRAGTEKIGLRQYLNISSCLQKYLKVI